MKKRAVIGLAELFLMPVVQNDLLGYAAKAVPSGAQGFPLPFAGAMTRTPKETTQDIDGDDKLYATIRVYAGDDVEIRLKDVSLETLEKLGLGKFNEDTETFEGNFAPILGAHSLRCKTDTVDSAPYFWKWRVFEINGARFDNFTTKGTGSVTVCEFIITGIFKEPSYRKAGPYAIRRQSEDGANEEACYAFLIEAEELPAAATATTPGAPTITSVTPGDGSVTVAFTEPADTGGSAITGYLALAQTGADEPVTQTGAASPITIAGLTNGEAYTVTVIAENAVGAGTPSEAETATPTA